MKHFQIFLRQSLVAFLAFGSLSAQSSETNDRLRETLEKFPEADTNKDGILTLKEGLAFRDKMRGEQQKLDQGNAAAKDQRFSSSSKPHPGWELEKFPEHAVSNRNPAEIKALYAAKVGEKNAVVSAAKPTDGSLRIIGMGHSFVRPGYTTLEQIAKTKGSQQVLYTHIGGGKTGSTRYKWEQENGIFRFDKRPTPKLLASLANGEWDVMTWGPFNNDVPKYYSCWIDFALKYQPNMKFYLMDAWPQRMEFEPALQSDQDVTAESIAKVNDKARLGYQKLIEPLRKKYGNRVFIMPTNDAFTKLIEQHLKSPIPEIEGLFQPLNGNRNSVWKDARGHVHPTFQALIGYVFYATLYQKNPMDLPPMPTKSKTLDEIFRKIAWEAVKDHPLSGL